ncbi:MAG: hypothetical protein MZU91_11840 [Desulfosudis oleivorans]|nr:hypothetical protein [Desulfosudis oleivorans]
MEQIIDAPMIAYPAGALRLLRRERRRGLRHRDDAGDRQVPRARRTSVTGQGPASSASPAARK